MIRTYKYICPNCNEEFWNRHKGCICCSKSCAGKYEHKIKGKFGLPANHYKPLLELKCYECGNVFKTKERFRIKFKRNFCSMNCYNKYKIKNNLLKGIQKKGHKNFPQWFIDKSRERMLGNKYRLGTKLTLEHKEKIGFASRGDKSNFWRGGISKHLVEYGSLFNQQLKERIRVRDNFKCRICGVPELEFERRLDIHHIDFNKKNNSQNNLVALCRSCHHKVGIKTNNLQMLLQKKGNSL